MAEKEFVNTLQELLKEVDRWQEEVMQICSLELSLAQACELNMFNADRYSPALYALHDKADTLLDDMVEAYDSAFMFLRQQDEGEQE